MARRRIVKMGFVFYETGQVEAGIDGLLELRDPDGTVRAQFLAAQIKARKKGAYTAETAEGFEYLCLPDDFLYWSGPNLPVIVVLARLEDNSVYWKAVECGIVDGTASDRRLLISKAEDRFDKRAAMAIALLAVDHQKHFMLRLITIAEMRPGSGGALSRFGCTRGSSIPGHIYQGYM